ncbi:hypothetical protein GCM10010199_70700 [Dactylosporangium roseum]
MTEPRPTNYPGPTAPDPHPGQRTVETGTDDAELVAAIAQRPHWQLGDRGAVYAPPSAGARVRVRAVRMPARARERYFAAVTWVSAANSYDSSNTRQPYGRAWRPRRA